MASNVFIATFVCRYIFGKHCMAGASSDVTKDVPDYALIVGNPGRIIGWVSEAGKRLKFDENNMAFCEKSGKHYQMKDNRVIEV